MHADRCVRGSGGFGCAEPLSGWSPTCGPTRGSAFSRTVPGKIPTYGRFGPPEVPGQRVPLMVSANGQ